MTGWLLGDHIIFSSSAPWRKKRKKKAEERKRKKRESFVKNRARRTHRQRETHIYIYTINREAEYKRSDPSSFFFLYAWWLPRYTALNKSPSLRSCQTFSNSSQRTPSALSQMTSLLGLHSEMMEGLWEGQVLLGKEEIEIEWEFFFSLLDV